jgi:Uma2 family endonuclease
MRLTELKPLSESEYLELEARSELRHELVAGQLYAMTGATVAHNRIAGGLYSRLLAAAGDACQVFISDVKLRADSLPTYYYPDVMVVCDPADDDRLAKTRPCLLAEVLSPATEATDRREKLAAYRRLPSLREYLLLAQDAPRIEVYRRRSLSDWVLEVLEAGDTVRIDCVDLRVGVSELYRGILA